MRYDRSGRARQPGGFRRFDPSRLFAAGQAGLIYPTELATLFQDGVGSVAATAVNQPLGFTLDTSGGLALGAERVTNGRFDTDLSGWSTQAPVLASWTANGIQINRNNGSFFNQPAAPISLVAGKSYRVEFSITSAPTTAFGGLEIINASKTASMHLAAAFRFTAVGTYTAYFTATATENAFVIVGISGVSVGAVTIDNVSVREIAGNHARQTLAIDRPILQSDAGGFAEQYNGTSSSKSTPTGGGGTTGFFWCGALRITKTGAVQTIFSDAGINAGYRVRINASNQLELAAGNGSAFVTVAASASLAGGERFVLTAWHDGTTLRAQVNNGTVAEASMGAVTAGTAQITIGKDNNAASSFFGGWLYYQLHRQTVPTNSEIAQLKSWIAARVGVTL